MMSEKRFFTKINKNGRNVIIDKECHTELFDMTLACEVLNRLDLKLKYYNEVNGEHQSTIEQKDKEIAELDQQCADFLGARIKAQEEWEKCTDKLKEKIGEQQATIEELRLQEKEKGVPVFVVREGKNPIALFFNEQRASLYCQENMANLTYQQEKWCRVE